MQQLDHSQHSGVSMRYPIRLLVHDMDVALNVGSVFRLADALGVEEVILSGTSVRPPHRQLKRTSRSAENHVLWRGVEEPLAEVAALKAQGYTLVSVELASDSIDVRELDVLPAAKFCLILGNENHGVSQALLDASDHCVHIPMRGRNSSMNVAMACAIVVFELSSKL